MADTTTTRTVSSCLGRTCLKWGADGDLEALDLDLVLERLAKVDLDLATLRQGTVESEPCRSNS